MVSPLSMRLTMDHNRAADSASNDQRQKMQNESISSGYCGDRDGDSSIGLPPVLIGLHHKRKLTCEEERKKRRKISEENYKASTVSQDLEKGGLPVPPLMRLRSRTSPFINISSVTHLTSKSIAESPFLHSINVNHDILTDYGNVYQELFRQTRPAYAAPMVRKEQSDSEDSTSTCSTSSMSESESCTSSKASPALLVIHARLDDTFNLDQDHPKVDNSVVQRQSPIASFALPPPRSLSVSLEDAVGICDKARLVASSVAPHRIIFANARFSAMTGLPSCKTLGRPVRELLDPEKPQVSSLEQCAARGEIETVVLNKEDKTVSCTMKVTPVLSEVKGPSALKIVTHFAIDFNDSAAHANVPVQVANNNSWDTGAFVYSVVA